MKLLFPKIMLGICGLLFAFGSKADHLSDQIMLTADLDGEHEVPSVTSDGKGIASLTFNSDWDSLSVNISVANLSSDITGIHIHSGASDENGSVVTDLTPWLTGDRITGVLTGDDLTSEIISWYLSGNMYINVHTTDHPSGEIRGQIHIESDWGFRASLDTAQQVHSVTVNAMGEGVFNISHDQQTMNVWVTNDGLSGAITAAHLHYGSEGNAGGVALDLSSLISGNSLVGSLDISSATDLVDSLMAGAIYINVHTTDNAAGEVRGQLWYQEGLIFDAWLNTDQQVTPPSVTDAEGTGYIWIDPTLDSMTFNIQATNLTGAISAAHIHQGESGVNGGVLVDLSSGIDGSRIMGRVAIDAAIIPDLLSAGTYFNIHTAANGAGEIRGQIYRVAREGYTLSLDGTQQDPVVWTNGMGSGFVSIDRDRTNAHFMNVLSGLSGAISGAHFHLGVEGESGGVVYNMTDDFMGTDSWDCSAGYWDMNGGFTTSNEVQFRSDSIYLNIHTAANAGGEIRGQVIRGFDEYEIIMAENGMIPETWEHSGILFFSAKLTGDQEVPAVTTTATGVAGVLVNATMDTIWLNLTVDGLSGGITGLHIHEGEAGTNGGAVIDLTSDVEGNKVTAVITSFDLSKFINGMYYINVHTDANAGGEIRGQIMPEIDWAFTAWIDGAQEVPAVTTDANGWANFALSQNEEMMYVSVLLDGLSGDITSAHLHNAASGTNGGVVVDLSSLIDGNTIMGAVDASSIINELLAGEIYINIHTAANPSGEVRGQLWLENGVGYDGWLNGAQSIPESNSGAMGVMSLYFSEAWDTLFVNALTSGLSSSITGVHLHDGATGISGGVLADLTSFVNDNVISGHVTGTDLSAQLIMQLLTGEVYLNVHTDNFPGGEIRGQVNTLAREGYSFDLCGAQEEPEVMADGYGTGIVSIDRYAWNAHFMITNTMLTGAPTGIHFHQAEAGQNGGVAFDLSSYVTDNSLFGYLTAAEGFDDASADLFDNEMIYVNVHTAANASGEIRGQVVKDWWCPGVITSVNTMDETAWSVVPNPVMDRLAINLADAQGDWSFQIVSSQGRVVLNGSVQNGQEISVASITAGVYQLVLNNGSITTSQTIVKY